MIGSTCIGCPRKLLVYSRQETKSETGSKARPNLQRTVHNDPLLPGRLYLLNSLPSPITVPLSGE